MWKGYNMVYVLCIISVHQCAFSPLWVIMNGWTTTCLLISLCWGLSYCSFVVLSTTSYEPRFWPTAMFYYHCYTSSCCQLIQLFCPYSPMPWLVHDHFCIPTCANCVYIIVAVCHPCLQVTVWVSPLVIGVSCSLVYTMHGLLVTPTIIAQSLHCDL